MNRSMTPTSQTESFGTICVVGAGYVGLTLAVAFADVGLNVVCSEVDREKVDRLRAGEPTFFEPGLAEKLARVCATGNLTFSPRIPDDHSIDYYIISVGTPLDPNGNVNMASMEAVTQEIAAHLKEGDTVILRSTVCLGTTSEVLMPVLDKVGVAYGISFCPERTVEGSALTELHELPQVVSGNNDFAVKRATALFSLLTPHIVPVSNVETAEMIKLTDNTLRDVMFGFGNEVAEACNAIEVSAAEVIEASRLKYQRSASLAKPGPVGGPCLEKDPHIRLEGLRKFNVDLGISVAARRINEEQPAKVMSFLSQLIGRSWMGAPSPRKIAICGLAFKGHPETDDLRGSMVYPMIAALRDHFPKAELWGFDHVVEAAGTQSLDLSVACTIEAAFDKCDLVVIANNHKQYKSLNLQALSERMSLHGLIYDFWANFQTIDLSLQNEVKYLALGSHTRDICFWERNS